MIRILSWLLIIAIFVAGSAAKGEERPTFLGGGGATTGQNWISARAAKLTDTKPEAYDAAMHKIPDKKSSADPWGDVRPAKGEQQ
jgi:hypothetical protein